MKEKTGVILNAKRLDEAFEILDDLTKLMDDRISDLYQIKGAMQARHAYIYYRSLVWKAVEELKKAQQQ
jgi:hypothetical protein